MSEAITKENLILGHKYREALLGREGVAVARCEYLTGNDKVEMMNLDMYGDARSFLVDISLLETVSKRLTNDEAKKALDLQDGQHS